MSTNGGKMAETKKEKKQLMIFGIVVGVGICLKALLYGESIRTIFAVIGFVAVLFSIYQIVKWYDKEENEL